MSGPGTGSDAPLRSLLSDEPRVVTAGVSLFADALASQGIAPVRTDWRPPVGGGAALARIAADDRVVDANEAAVTRLQSARPHLVDLQPAREAIAGFDDGMLLHAGPPIAWADASGPLRGAIIGALLYEGWADDPDAAAAMAGRGDIDLAPCHEHGAVGPMAGVVSPSMPMYVLHDEEHGTTAHCTQNEGLGKVLRYGAFGTEVVDRLHWMERTLAPLTGAALRAHGPVDVRSLIVQALQMGDEGHNRNRAGSSLFLREIAGDLVEVDAAASDIAAVLRFINGNDHFFLNLVMPAAKTAADAARDIPGSTMVIAMARNGTEFGIQCSGTGGQWFTAAAGVPDGLFLSGYGPEDANPDIGDSTITETAGIGGFAMAAAPAIVRFVGGEVSDALAFTLSMYEITLAEHTSYQIPILGFRGTPVGIDATKVVRTGIAPAVNTGMAGREAGTGQVGAGLVEPPIECFVAAVEALAERVDASPAPSGGAARVESSAAGQPT
ncbi:MAG TPA: DUF1116 domain-containing protein [Euzebyales bacterium]|nr:DUF1116 domain-containing protein [Euzebyales bacterium]